MTPGGGDHDPNDVETSNKTMRELYEETMADVADPHFPLTTKGKVSMKTRGWKPNDCLFSDHRLRMLSAHAIGGVSALSKYLYAYAKFKQPGPIGKWASFCTNIGVVDVLVILPQSPDLILFPTTPTVLPALLATSVKLKTPALRFYQSHERNTCFNALAGPWKYFKEDEALP